MSYIELWKFINTPRSQTSLFGCTSNLATRLYHTDAKVKLKSSQESDKRKAANTKLKTSKKSTKLHTTTQLQDGQHSELDSEIVDTPQITKDQIESIQSKLYIHRIEDWYDVPAAHIKNVAGAGAILRIYPINDIALYFDLTLRFLLPKNL